MQHVKDTLLLIVTSWAAIVAGRVMALIVFSAWPPDMESGVASGVILCVLMFLAGLIAGVHLMKHLKWAARFWIVVLVPFCFVTLNIVANSVRVAKDEAFLDKLAWTALAQLELVVFAIGILFGAFVQRARGQQRKEQRA